MGARVFLSYAPSDQVLANLVAARLETVQDGLAVAQRDGAPFGDELRSKFRNSDAFLVVMSGPSVQSADLMTQFGAALALDRPIVVIHPDAEPLPLELPTGVRVVEAAGLSPEQIADTVRARLAP